MSANYPHQPGPPQGKQHPGQPGAPASKQVPPVVVAAVLVVTVLGGVAGAFGLRANGAKIDAKCGEAVQAVRDALAKNDDAALQSALGAARPVCVGDARLAAVEAETNQRQAATQRQAAHEARIAAIAAARPALLKAGYKPEQLDEAAMTSVCRRRGFMVVPMQADNVPGSPPYWDCDKAIVFQDAPRVPADCTEGLEYTNFKNEFGERVGACKKAAPPEPIGAMRIKKDGPWVGASTKGKLEKAISLAALDGNEAFQRYVKSEPGVTLMQPGLDVTVVQGAMSGPVLVRKRANGGEVWVQAESLEMP